MVCLLVEQAEAGSVVACKQARSLGLRRHDCLQVLATILRNGVGNTVGKKFKMPQKRCNHNGGKVPNRSQRMVESRTFRLFTARNGRSTPLSAVVLSLVQANWWWWKMEDGDGIDVGISWKENNRSRGKLALLRQEFECSYWPVQTKTHFSTPQEVKYKAEWDIFIVFSC